MSGVPSTSTSNSRLLSFFEHKKTRLVAITLSIVSLVLLSFGFGLLTRELTIEKQNVIVQGDLRESTTVEGVSKEPETVEDADSFENLDSLNVDLLAEIINILSSDFVDADFIDAELLRDAAIEGILAALNDPHTDYVTQDEVELGNLDIGFYEGIGATVGGNEGGVIQIGVPFRDSPAERAGVRAGDLIIEVDGASTEGWSVAKAVSAIRGESGTEVVLTVVHTDGTEPRTEKIIVVRGGIQVPSVSRVPLFEVFRGSSGVNLVDRDQNLVSDIAYIHIQQFTPTTLNEIFEVLGDLEAQKEFWNEDMIWHGPPGFGEIHSLEGFLRDELSVFYEAFPDFNGDFDIIFANENWVAATGYVTGTHKGDWLGIPATGKPMKMRYSDFWLIKDNMLLENWVMLDHLSVLEQIGINPFNNNF